MFLGKFFLLTVCMCFGGVQCIIVCECDTTGSVSVECGVGDECECKPGVGGAQCDQCLPGFTDFGADGCRSLTECQCHPQGSLSRDCNENGSCVCRLGVQGRQCDSCQDGFRRIDLGCIPCPTCFNEVATQFSLSLELYSNLLQRLNDSLSSNTTNGLSQDLLDDIMTYRTLLTDLLQRAINATTREQGLNSDLAGFTMEISDLMSEVDNYDVNVTNAEERVEALTRQANRTLSLYQELSELVRSLETRININLRQQFTDLLSLSQQLARENEELSRLASEVDDISLRHQSQANDLLSLANATFNNLTLAIQSLQEAIGIQNQLLQILQGLENGTLPRLELLYTEGVSALNEAEISVPVALENSTSILETLLGIEISQYNLNDHQIILDSLRNETDNLFVSVSLLNATLDILLANFSQYNATASRLFIESEELNNEAEELLAIAREALLSANNSVTIGNEVIQEARRLLTELQNRLLEGREFTTGLESVIANIELAERLSLLAENETGTRERELMEAMNNANMATALLESASLNLANAYQIASNVSESAAQLLSNAVALNESASGLAEEVSQADRGVNELAAIVQEDTETIAMVADTANDTIAAAANLTTRLLIINDLLVTLTQELDNITLISPERIQNINSTLTNLEGNAASNQVLVDSLTQQVRQLQESADELQERYTQVQQHRDLLRDILRNVQELNCREQFEN